jgi:hypothetical protein
VRLPEEWWISDNGLLAGLLMQVLSFAAVVTPNQDMAFMIAIAWTAVNLLMSNFMVRYVDMTQQWLSQLKYVTIAAMSAPAAGCRRCCLCSLRVCSIGNLLGQLSRTGRPACLLLS